MKQNKSVSDLLKMIGCGKLFGFGKDKKIKLDVDILPLERYLNTLEEYTTVLKTNLVKNIINKCDKTETKDEAADIIMKEYPILNKGIKHYTTSVPSLYGYLHKLLGIFDEYGINYYYTEAMKHIMHDKLDDPVIKKLSYEDDYTKVIGNIKCDGYYLIHVTDSDEISTTTDKIGQIVGADYYYLLYRGMDLILDCRYLINSSLIMRKIIKEKPEIINQDLTRLFNILNALTFNHCITIERVLEETKLFLSQLK